MLYPTQDDAISTVIEEIVAEHQQGGHRPWILFLSDSKDAHALKAELAEALNADIPDGAAKVGVNLTDAATTDSHNRLVEAMAGLPGALTVSTVTLSPQLGGDPKHPELDLTVEDAIRNEVELTAAGAHGGHVEILDLVDSGRAVELAGWRSSDAYALWGTYRLRLGLDHPELSKINRLDRWWLTRNAEGPHGEIIFDSDQQQERVRKFVKRAQTRLGKGR